MSILQQGAMRSSRDSTYAPGRNSRDNCSAPSRHADLCPDALGSGDTSGVQPPPYEDVVASRGERCCSCCKKFVAFLFSTIGLTSMLVGYTIFGGFIFTRLEAPHEVHQKSAVLDARTWHVQRLWNVTIQMNVFYEPNWTEAATALLENYTELVYEATKRHGWDGKEDSENLQWTFAGAMLYSVTVITTIGYGHIAPRTTWGRIVTIVYAIVGIPLCLLTLTNLGGFMATAFRYLYNNICCGLCCLCCESPTRKQKVKSSALRYKDKDIEKGDPSASEALTSPDPAVSLTDDVEKEDKSPVVVTWREGLRRVLKTDDRKRVSVPIYVSLLLIAGYILSGAVLFTLWEEDWDYLVGSYFCFITLTTIGFGDYVPGTDTNSWDNQEKLVLCALYLIFGLSLIAMCFDLMQEEARNKVRALGKKLGLIQSEKRDNDANSDNAQADQTTEPATDTSRKGTSPSVKKSNKPKKSESKASLNSNNIAVEVMPTANNSKQSKKSKKKKNKSEADLPKSSSDNMLSAHRLEMVSDDNYCLPPAMGSSDKALSPTAEIEEPEDVWVIQPKYVS